MRSECMLEVLTFAGMEWLATEAVSSFPCSADIYNLWNITSCPSYAFVGDVRAQFDLL
jgi:hypothetical protein